MNSRTTNIVFVAATLAAVTLQAIVVKSSSAFFTEIELGVFQILIGFGFSAALFAVFPARNGAGVTFDRAADLSRMSLDIGVARPALMRGGMLALGIGLAGTGVAQLFGKVL